MKPVWPVTQRPDAHYVLPQVITFGSDAPHHVENRGADLAGELHCWWLAFAHQGARPVFIGAWESLGTAGAACELQWEHQGRRYNLRYCHGHEHYLARWPVVSLGTFVAVGAPIGEVGMTGLTTGPHLHLAAAVDCQAGGLLESGTRVDADALINEIVASYEAGEPGQEDDVIPTEEQLGWLTKAWQIAERLEKPGIPKRSEERTAAQVLKDVVRSIKGEPTERPL